MPLLPQGKTAGRDRKAETAAERIAAERRGTKDSAGSKTGGQAAVNGQGGWLWIGCQLDRLSRVAVVTARGITHGKDTDTVSTLNIGHKGLHPHNHNGPHHDHGKDRG
jgi:hypothetical protein